MPEFVLQVQDIDETGRDYSFVLTRAWLDASLADAGLRGDPDHPLGVITVHAQKNGSEYLVNGQVRAALTMDCVRCLAVARAEVDSEFATLFSKTSTPRSESASKAASSKTAAGKPLAARGDAPGKPATARGSDGAPSARTPRRAAHETLEVSNEDDDDPQREEFSGYEIVLDDLIREFLVLDAPMQPLCSEQCEGIAVPEHVRPPEDVFGPSDGSVDPRLAPLLRLRDKVPPNKE